MQFFSANDDDDDDANDDKTGSTLRMARVLRHISVLTMGNYVNVTVYGKNRQHGAMMRTCYLFLFDDNLSVTSGPTLSGAFFFSHQIMLANGIRSVPEAAVLCVPNLQTLR